KGALDLAELGRIDCLIKSSEPAYPAEDTQDQTQVSMAGGWSHSDTAPGTAAFTGRLEFGHILCGPLSEALSQIQRLVMEEGLSSRARCLGSIGSWFFAHQSLNRSFPEPNQHSCDFQKTHLLSQGPFPIMSHLYFVYVHTGGT